MRRLIIRDAGRIVYFSANDIQINFKSDVIELDPGTQEASRRYILRLIVYKHQGIKNSDVENTYEVVTINTDDVHQFAESYYALIKEFEQCSPNGEIVVTSPDYQAWEHEVWGLANTEKGYSLLEALDECSKFREAFLLEDNTDGN